MKFRVRIENRILTERRRQQHSVQGTENPNAGKEATPKKLRLDRKQQAERLNIKKKEVNPMLEYLKIEMNRTETENGAATHVSSGSDCLDLFATVGALRRESDAEILRRFARAFAEDADLAVKLLFFARDIRGGLGERRVFRVVLRRLADERPETVRKNLPYVAEFGRYDDLLVLLGTRCGEDALALLKTQFEKDLAALDAGEDVSLLGKWLPSVNASNLETVRLGKKVARAFGMRESAYRKALVSLRAKIRILENDLRLREYGFDYAKQPSRAMFKYRKAFLRNDGERYRRFMNQVVRGEVRLHADNVCPYELVAPWLGYSGMKTICAEEKEALNATWASLPDFGGEENALAVIDTSGSMYMDADPCPAAVALSLGLYFAERNRGAFRNCFIEFSRTPALIELKGETFADRLAYAASFSRIANTDLEAVFDAILRAAVRGNVPAEELPAKLVIISDMEFDACVKNSSLTNFENAKAKYEAHGYRLPEIVFWNVASRHRQQPVAKNEQGVCLVSGATPRLFSMIAGGIVTPYVFMTDVLGSDRYAKITA